MIVMRISLTAYTNLFVSSILREQKPDRFSFNASGLPIPSNAERRILSANLFMTSFRYLNMQCLA